MTPCAITAGAAAHLNASYLMAKEAERKLSLGCSHGGGGDGDVCVFVGGAEMCPRCGKTSSFVYGEVIGTPSLPGEATQASRFLSLSFSQSGCGSCGTSWPPPPLTPVASSLSHDFLFPARLPASPTHRRPWPGSVGGVATRGETVEASRKMLTGRMAGCPPPSVPRLHPSSSSSPRLHRH